MTYDPLSEQQKYDIRQQCRRFLDGNLDELDVCRMMKMMMSVSDLPVIVNCTGVLFKDSVTLFC